MIFIPHPHTPPHSLTAGTTPSHFIYWHLGIGDTLRTTLPPTLHTHPHTNTPTHPHTNTPTHQDTHTPTRPHTPTHIPSLSTTRPREGGSHTIRHTLPHSHTAANTPSHLTCLQLTLQNTLAWTHRTLTPTHPRRAPHTLVWYWVNSHTQAHSTPLAHSSQNTIAPHILAAQPAGLCRTESALTYET